MAVGPGARKVYGRVKDKYYAVKGDQEVPQAKELAPEADSIINAVCKFYNVSRDELYRSRRGRFNEPRNAAIFLTRKLRHDRKHYRLSQIGSNLDWRAYPIILSKIIKT